MNTDKLKKSLRDTNSAIVKIVCVIILFSAVLSAVRTAYDSHVSFYEKKPNEKFLTLLNSIGNIKHYDLFLDYTGLGTGYGFFSPNVSSDFVVTHLIYENGKTELTFSNSFLTTKEGSHRFANLNSLYMEKLDEVEKDAMQEKDSLKMKYLEVILNRLNNYKLAKNKNTDSIKTTLYLHHFPFLKDYPDVKPKLIKIESHTKYKK